MYPKRHPFSKPATSTFALFCNLESQWPGKDRKSECKTNSTASVPDPAWSQGPPLLAQPPVWPCSNHHPTTPGTAAVVEPQMEPTQGASFQGNPLHAGKPTMQPEAEWSWLNIPRQAVGTRKWGSQATLPALSTVHEDHEFRGADNTVWEVGQGLASHGCKWSSARSARRCRCTARPTEDFT